MAEQTSPFDKKLTGDAPSEQTDPEGMPSEYQIRLAIAQIGRELKDGEIKAAAKVKLHLLRDKYWRDLKYVVAARKQRAANKSETI